MRTLKKLLAMTAVTCMAVTTLTACGDAGSASAEDEIKIGLNFELSGATANYGTPENNGAKLAIKQANAKEGNKFKYSGIEGDNKSLADESTTVASKLITSDGVQAIVGPATSGASAATYQIATDSKVFVVSPSATTTNIIYKDAKDLSKGIYDYVYRACFEDAYQGAAMAVYAYDTLGKTKAAVFSDTSSDYAKGLAKAYTETFEKRGGEIVMETNYQAGDTDFNTQLTKIKNSDFDVLYIPGYYTEVGPIIKQAREMGIMTPIVGSDGFDSTDLVKLAGDTKYLNDIYFTTAYTTVGASPALTQFIKDYEAEYGEEPSMFSALAFDSTNVMIQAFEEAGSKDPEIVKTVMDGINFVGVTGAFTFDEAHTPKKDALVVRLVDGVQTDAVGVNPNE